MKANGASGSRRFSARLKCTRPTRFQAGFRPLRKLCRSAPVAASDVAKAAPQLCPQRPQDVRRQVFGARHHGRRQHQSGEFAFGRRRHVGKTAGRRAARSSRRLQAQRRHVARRESAPPDEDRRQGCPTSPRAEPQQSLSASAGKRLGQTRRGGRVHLGRVVSGLADEMSVRRHPQAESGSGDVGPDSPICGKRDGCPHRTGPQRAEGLGSLWRAGRSPRLFLIPGARAVTDLCIILMHINGTVRVLPAPAYKHPRFMRSRPWDLQRLRVRA